MKNLSLIALLLMFLVSCQPKEALDPPTDSQGVEQRSNNPRDFSATIQSTVNADPESPLTLCSGDLPGFGVPDHFLGGIAVHLGQLDGELSTLHHDDCDLSFETLTLTTNVSGQIAAANGDLIYYTGLDVIDVSGLLTQTSTTGSINGTWTITGGTGRFEDATGSFEIVGVVDLVAGTFSAEAEGTITY